TRIPEAAPDAARPTPSNEDDAADAAEDVEDATPLMLDTQDDDTRLAADAPLPDRSVSAEEATAADFCADVPTFPISAAHDDDASRPAEDADAATFWNSVPTSF
ncbi:hypothetical protein ACTMPO_14330, partial [Enterococcus faecium]